jgi:hypothetical protein
LIFLFPRHEPGELIVILAHVFDMYGIPTKALNQAVKRNADRFPEDFAFRLTAEEKAELVTNCDRRRDCRQWEYSKLLPSARAP